MNIMQPLGKTEQQYKSVIRFLNARHTDGKKAKVLEIGAYAMIIKRFLPPSLTYHSLDIGGEENAMWGIDKNTKYTYMFDLDKGKLPIKSETYDYVICYETLEHVMYPDRVLSEIQRVAKKDAIVFLSLPNEYNFVQRIYFMLGRKTYCDEPFQIIEKHLHIHKPRAQDIIDLFARHFKILKVEYIWQSTKLNSWGDKLINLLAQFMPSLFARVVLVQAKQK